MLCGLSPEEKQQLELTSAEDYWYLNQVHVSHRAARCVLHDYYYQNRTVGTYSAMHGCIMVLCDGQGLHSL